MRKVIWSRVIYLILKQSVFVPKGSGKPCWLAREDYARTAVSALTGKTLLRSKTYVTGPESLGIDDLAQRWSDLHGRKLDVQNLPGKEVVDRLVAKGTPIDVAKELVRNCKVLRMTEVPITDTVERATGIPTTSVDGVLRDLAFD